MVVTEDDMKTLDDLLHSAKHELRKDHTYLDMLEAEIGRARINPQRRTDGGTPTASSVYDVASPESIRGNGKGIVETRVRSMLISDANLSNLRQLLDAARRFLTRNHHHLQSLEENLKRAQVVACDQVPPDVITIHTQVRIHELDIGRHSIYTLVLPGEADVARDRISVLAPIGSALLGQRVGDLIECTAPGVTKRLKVKEIVYQPEAIRTAA